MPPEIVVDLDELNPHARRVVHVVVATRDPLDDPVQRKRSVGVGQSQAEPNPFPRVERQTGLNEETVARQVEAIVGEKPPDGPIIHLDLDWKPHRPALVLPHGSTLGHRVSRRKVALTVVGSRR